VCEIELGIETERRNIEFGMAEPKIELGIETETKRRQPKLKHSRTEIEQQHRPKTKQ
jgi:hypothetical protein